MARGHTTTRPTEPAVRAADAANPWADPQLPTDAEGLLALVGEYRHARLAEIADEQLALDLGPSDGTSIAPKGVAPLHALPLDTGRYAPFIAAAALHLRDPDDPRITQILRDTHAALAEHHRRLEDALSAPDADAYRDPVLRFFELHHDGPGVLAANGRDLLGRLAELRADISLIVDGRVDATTLLSEATRDLHWRANRHACERVIQRLLMRGEHLHLLAGLIAGSPLQFDETHRSDMVRAARIYDALGEQVPWIDHLTEPRTWMNTTHHPMRRLDAFHTGQGAKPDPHAALRMRASANGALAFAHTLLADPRRFGAGYPMEHLPGLRVNVAVDEAAFIELHERFAAGPTWGGIGAFRIEQRVFGGRARGDLHLPPAGDSTIGACARLVAEVGGARGAGAVPAAPRLHQAHRGAPPRTGRRAPRRHRRRRAAPRPGCGLRGMGHQPR